MEITVKELINEPFYNRTQENKIKIVAEGKPRPLLNMSTVTLSVNGEMNTENFDPVVYDEVQWLTGCETERSFYCWPCLLFSPENEQWKVTDLAFLPVGISEHEKSVGHIPAVLNLKKFCSEQVEKVNLEHDKCNHVYSKNRKNMKLLIDVVCCIVAKEQSFPGKNSCQNQIKPEIYVKALNLLKLCDKYLFNVKDAVELIKTSPTLLSDLVDAVTEVVKLAITKEVRMSTYAALIISDHSTNHEISQLSLILRYIKKGKVYERFLGFINILVFKSVDVIHEIIESTIATFGITDKFLAYSFNGAVLETWELINLNSLLQNKYPQSYFVPCYFHRLQDGMQQSLSVHEEVTLFFKILGVMEAYFQEASEQRKEFEQFMFLNTSRENSKWYVKAPFITIVHRCRNHFLEALKSIIKNCTNWTADDNIKAHGLIRFLEEFHTVCLLHILSPLFNHIMLLEDSLKSRSPELDFRSDLIAAIMNDVLTEESRFEEYFNSAIQEMDKAINNGQESKRLNIDYKDLKGPFQSLFIKIIEHFEKEIMLRFSKLDDLSFCSLVNVHSIDVPNKRLDYWYWKLNEAPRHNFSSQLFDSEVVVQRTNGIFGNKTAYDLLTFFEKSNLKSVFKCTNRLLEFTLTMPFRPPGQDGNSSNFQKINRLSYPTECIKAGGDASVLFIESDFLEDLRFDVFFYDDVIQKLNEVNKSK